MAVSDSAKVDLLYKKLFGVAKTDLPANKSPSNEAIASPTLIRGDKVWQQATNIPGIATATAGIVQAYTGASAVQCTADTTSTPISSVYPSWKTNLTDWIPSEFGSTYFVQVWVDSSGVANPTSTGTQIFDSGIAGVGEWNFDYQSGVLNFIGGTIPASLTVSKVIYVVGYRYIGYKGVTDYPGGITMGNITISGNTISTSSGNVYIAGNLTINGSSVSIGTSDLSIQDPMINLHTFANLAPLTYNDGYDIGLKFHYYDTLDSAGFLGRANDTGFLEWYSRGSDSANVFIGTAYGTFKTGELLLTNTTPSTSTITGALRVSGGVGIVGNLYVSNISISGNTISGNTGITVANALTVNGNVTASNVSSTFYGNVHSDYISANIGNVVVFDTTGAIKLPTGSTAQQPAGVTGYIRFNTDTPALEYYNGTAWVPVTNTVTDQQITGDGVNTIYTLDQTATNVGVLVSINGTLQAPGTAYSVSGDQITFAEVPLVTDVIDVRYLGSTVSLNSTLTDDLVVSGNLTVNGNIVNTNNLYTYGNTQVAAYLVANPQGSTYSNANVVANLQNYVTNISTTANVTTTANIIAPNYLFANGVNILSTVAASSTYSNTNVSAYLTSQNITSANIGSYQTWANANVSGLYNSITGANTTIQTLNANVGAYEIYANANIGTLYNGNISTQANLGAFQTYANANIGTLYNGNVSTNANLGAFQTYANTTVSVLQANLGVTQIWANANVATINANLGAYQTWANANVAGLQTSITSLRTTANTNTAAYLAAGISTNITTTGNISASNVLINGAQTSFGTVNPAYIVVGLVTGVTGFGVSSTFILDTVVGNVNSQTSYNTSTGVFTLTAGVTYDMSFTPSFISFSNTTGGYLCYQWVDASTNTPLDSTGIGMGTVVPTTDTSVQNDNPTARVIYTPSTNQTVKLYVTSGNGTATLRGGIGTQAVVRPLNLSIAVQATATGTVNNDYIQAGRITSGQTVSNAATPQDVIFNTSIATNSGIAHNTSTGVFTLTAGKTYELESQLTYTGMNSTGDYILFNWVDATTNALLDTTGISTGTVVPATWASNAAYGTLSKLVYTPSTNQTVKVRITAGLGSGTIMAGQGTYAKITQINQAFALNNINGITVTGNATVGNLIAGVTGYTILPNIVAQFTSNVNSYGQINAQNINSGTDATTEIVATANNGTDTIFFVDLGIAGNTYDNASPSNSLGTIIYANDAYLYAQGNTSANVGGNLAIGTSTASRVVTVFAGGINNTSTVATFANTGLTAAGNLTVVGNITQQTAYYETYGNISNTGGNLTCNFNLGTTFYANLTANVTANFTNVNAVSSTVTGATIIVDQGATAYRVANVQVNGVNQTVKWVGATTGVGTASNTDVMSFSLIHLGSGTYRVLGQISNYA
jgi:hypothetical protein